MSISEHVQAFLRVSEFFLLDSEAAVTKDGWLPSNRVKVPNEDRVLRLGALIAHYAKGNAGNGGNGSQGGSLMPKCRPGNT